MARTVKVRLELDRNDYKAGLRDAANDTRTFDGEVRAAGKDLGAMGIEVKTTASRVEAMGSEADVAARKTTALGDEAAKAKTKATGLGDETGKTKAKIVDLAKEIDTTKAALKSLGEEFQRTGQVNVSELNRLSNGLRELERAKNAIEKLIPGGNGGNNKNNGGGLLNFALDEFIPKITKAAAGAMANGLESGAQSAGKAIASNPWIAAAVVAGITLGVPAIGGALAAAIGAGGIAAGILLAAKDPRTKAAWGEFASEAKIELTGAASPFVDSLVRGAGHFQATLRDKIMPSIRADFVTLAPVTDRLFSGAAGFVEKLMPGIDALSSQGAKVLGDIANELPRLGAAVSNMMESISAGGEGGREALHDLLLLVEASAFSIGKTTEGLEKWYQAERSLVQALTGDFKGARDAWLNLRYGINMDEAVKPVSPAVMATWRAAVAAVGAMGPTAQLTADDLKQLSGEINTTALDANILAGQMTDKVMGAMLGMSHATLGIAESLTSLHDTIHQNGLAIDRHTGLVAMNTKAGQQNREAVLSEIEANLRQYDAMIQSGASAEDAAKKYDTNTKALHDQLRAAGYTEAQVHDLIGEYGNVPSKVNTTIATQGLTAAIDGLADLIRKLNGMPTRRDIYVTEHLSTVGGFSYKSPDRLYDYPGGRYGAVTSYAQGGTAMPAGIYQTMSGPGIFKFAEPETGGEAYIPRNVDHSRAMQIASVVGGWHGFDVVPRQAPNYAALANSRPMAYAGQTMASLDADRLADAIASRVVPALTDLAALADRPINVNVDNQRIAQAVRQGNRGLERRG